MNQTEKTLTEHWGIKKENQSNQSKLLEALDEQNIRLLAEQYSGNMAAKSGVVDRSKHNARVNAFIAGYIAALESYKDGWVSELDQLEKWIKEEAEDFRTSQFSEDRSVGCYLSMCVLGKIQELKSPQTKTI